MHSMSVVTGISRTAKDAEGAYESARARGYADNDITVVMTEETRSRLFPAGTRSALNHKVAEEADNKTSPAELGGPKGGTMGTLAPVLAAAGVFLLLPGFGIIAAGPLAVALTAAGTVGLAGGLVGALTHWGIPPERTETYESSIRNGGILLGVNVHDAAELAYFREAWSRAGAELVHG
jgi:hypothetical protein